MPISRGAEHRWRRRQKKSASAWNPCRVGALMLDAKRMVNDRRKQMHSIFYIIGVVVVVVAILNFIA